MKNLKELFNVENAFGTIPKEILLLKNLKKIVTMAYIVRDDEIYLDFKKKIKLKYIWVKIGEYIYLNSSPL